MFLEGGLSAIELRSFLDQELPDWLDQLDPVIAPALRNAESLMREITWAAWSGSCFGA